MSTTTITDITYQYNILELIRYFGQFLMGNLEGTDVIVGPTADSLNGYKSISASLTRTDGANTLIYNYIQVFMPLKEDETIPARALLANSLLEVPQYVSGGVTTTIPNRWLTLKTVFDASFVETMRVVLAYFCDASVGGEIAWETTPIGSKLFNQRVMLPVTTDGECLMAAASLYWTPNPNSGTTRENVGGLSAVQGYANPALVSCDAQLMARIASALEDLSQSRIEISANNGDRMFSVTGGTRAALDAPGGG